VGVVVAVVLVVVLVVPGCLGAKLARALQSKGRASAPQAWSLWRLGAGGWLLLLLPLLLLLDD